jgi:phosphoribosyl 1,2-cyclic phosphodiesterase
MRLCSIASGSSGNCIYIGSEETHILVDAGISCKRIEAGLKKAELTGNDISGLFITHEHSDHIQGLGVLARRYGIPIYATKGTIEGILHGAKSLGEINEALFHEVNVDEDFQLGDLTVHPFRISHDAKEPCGYRFESDGREAAIATDLGTFNPYIVENLQGVNAVLLEANHDVRMLQAGPYTYALKQRILSDRGHLSNENSGLLLNKILHDDLKHILLGHLSKENNMPELAFETVKLEINAADTPYRAEELDLRVASRSEVGEVLNF